MNATVRVIKRKRIYRGRIFELVHDTLSIGGRQVTRDSILHPGAVVILPIRDDGRVVFVRQYRHAVGKWLLELPAGTLEPGESPVRCARRELQEETGYLARHLKRMTQFYSAPGFVSERLTLFLATDLQKTVARPEHDELLHVVTLTLPQAIQAIKPGRICDAKSLIGIMLLAQRRGSLAPTPFLL